MVEHQTNGTKIELNSCRKKTKIQITSDGDFISIFHQAPNGRCVSSGEIKGKLETLADSLYTIKTNKKSKSGQVKMYVQNTQLHLETIAEPKTIDNPISWKFIFERIE